MSVEQSIRCDGRPGGVDGPQCQRSGYSRFPWHNTPTKLRSFLRHQDWHRTKDGRDVCPDCWTDGCYKPGAGPSPRWCAACHVLRPCDCDPDEGQLLLPGEDEDNPWNGDPSTAPESAWEALGLTLPDETED